MFKYKNITATYVVVLEIHNPILGHVASSILICKTILKELANGLMCV